MEEGNKYKRCYSNYRRYVLLILFLRTRFPMTSDYYEASTADTADFIYFKNIDSLYRLSGCCIDDSFSWAYYMVKQMGQDLGDVGENKYYLFWE